MPSRLLDSFLPTFRLSKLPNMSIMATHVVSTQKLSSSVQRIHNVPLPNIEQDSQAGGLSTNQNLAVNVDNGCTAVPRTSAKATHENTAENVDPSKISPREIALNHFEKLLRKCVHAHPVSLEIPEPLKYEDIESLISSKGRRYVKLIF